MIHPLSTFPQLFTFGLIVPLMFRLTVGTIGITAARARFTKEYKWLSLAYGIVSLLIVVGLYTQIAAILGIILTVVDRYLENKKAPLSEAAKAVYTITIVILFSFLFSGAGFLAIDLPL